MKVRCGGAYDCDCFIIKYIDYGLYKACYFRDGEWH